MGQAIGIHSNVTLNAGYFLTRIVTLALRRASVLDGLGVNNQKSGVRAAPMVLSDLAN